MTAKKFAVFSFAAGLIGLLAAVYADAPQYAAAAGAVLIYSAVLFWQVYKLNKQIGEAEYRTRAEKLKADAEAEKSAQALLRAHNKIKEEKDEGQNSLAAAQDKHKEEKQMLAQAAEDESKKLREQIEFDKSRHGSEVSVLRKKLLSSREILDYYATKEGLDLYAGDAALREVGGIYVIKNMDDNAQNKVKIGETGDFARRFKEVESLVHKAGISAIAPHILVPLDEGRKYVERNIHKELAGHKTSNEWFDISPDRAMAVVCAHVFVQRMSNLQRRDKSPLLIPPDLSHTPVYDIIKDKVGDLKGGAALYHSLGVITYKFHFKWGYGDEMEDVREDLDGLITNEDGRFADTDVGPDGYVKSEAVVRALLAESPASGQTPAPYWSAEERKRIEKFSENAESLVEIVAKAHKSGVKHPLLNVSESDDSMEWDILGALHDAGVNYGDISLCDMILQNANADLIIDLADFTGYGDTDDDGDNPLQCAIKLGRTKVALGLITKAGMLDIDKQKGTMLHFCARNQADVSVVKTLVEFGLDVNAVDASGDTALDIAEAEGGRDGLIACALRRARRNK